jgi:hypothetical protein
MEERFKKKHIRIIVPLVVTVILLTLIILVFILVPLGPGLPPTGIREYRFIPGPNGPPVHDNTLYPVSTVNNTCTSVISVPLEGGLHAEYGVSGTSARLSVDSWYFQKYDDFQETTCQLCQNLLEKGSIEPVVLHIEDCDDNEYDLQATRYSTDLFQGYFIVAERPFLSSSEDYFIIFYGFIDDDHNRSSDRYVENLISQANIYAVRGSTRGLDCERCEKLGIE